MKKSLLVIFVGLCVIGSSNGAPMMALEADGDTVARVHNMHDGCMVYRNHDWQKNPEGDKCFGLDKGVYEVAYEDGIIIGTYQCANNKDEPNAPGLPNGTNGQYCWCTTKVGINISTDEIYGTDGQFPYNFSSDFGSSTECERRCAFRCAFEMQTLIDLSRAEVYGTITVSGPYKSVEEATKVLNSIK